MLSERIKLFLTNRGLDADLAAKLGVQTTQATDGSEALCFSFQRNTEIVNRKYRSLNEKKFWQDKGGKQIFWQRDTLDNQALDQLPLVITEGELDTLATIQSGFSRCISVPGGAPSEAVNNPNAAKYAFLQEAMPVLDQPGRFQKIILATDADKNGSALAADLADRLGKARCYWVEYPNKCKDLGEVLQRYGVEAVRQILTFAKPWQLDGLYTVDQLPPCKEREAFTTGWPDLDPHFKIRPGDFSVITGIPGAGKTTWVNDLSCRLASLHDWNILHASFEHHPSAEHVPSLLQWHCQKTLNQATDTELSAARDFVAQRFLFTYPGDDLDASIDWLEETIRGAVFRHNVRMAIIDPWNELDHLRNRDESLTEYVGRCIRRFKRLADRLSIHVMVVAHPTKLRDIKELSLYSISDSAHWANKPDVGLILTSEQGATTLRVVKSRNHDKIGKPGTVNFEFNPYTRRFSVDVLASERKWSKTKSFPKWN
jgi:twinkle protein